MKRFLIILAVVKLSFASVENLLSQTYINVNESELKKEISLAIGAYNDGFFQKAKDIGLKILNNPNIPFEKKGLIFEMLSSLAFKTNNKVLAKLLISRLKKDGKKLPLVVQQRIFVNLYNTLKDRKLKQKFSKLIHPKSKSFSLPEKLKKLGFKKGLNVFYINNLQTPIESNRIIFSKKDQTLYEIAARFDMGADELKEANPLLDPFDVLKGDAIIIPLHRILPDNKLEEKVIYINLPEKRIYYLLDKHILITFPIGVGTDNTQSPIGTFYISEKRKNPAWYVPENIRKEEPDLPAIVPPGENNPLGTRAMRLGNTNYLIHGTNKRFGVGLKVSHGCIRMYNSDVEKLFELVNKGTKVVIVNKVIKKIGKSLELHGRTYELKTIKPFGGVSQPVWRFVKNEKRGYAFPLKELLP